jgi:hypothetical protein
MSYSFINSFDNNFVHLLINFELATEQRAVVN